MAINKQPLKVVVVGHVDDGKSTLIGRLLYETQSISKAKIEELEQLSQKRGMAMEWSFVLDAFQAERDQAITIDTSQVVLKLDEDRVKFIDAPGHIEFLKNMVSAASQAKVAFLVVDAHEGVREQTYRHCYLLSLLGINHVAVLINKMDLVEHSELIFHTISDNLNQYLGKLKLKSDFIIPISARHGENLMKISASMPWYQGATVIEALKFFNSLVSTERGPLRFLIQGLYKFDHRRIYAGRIISGKLKLGDCIIFSPSNKNAVVKSIEVWQADPKQEASAGESIGITLDPQIFIERGEVASSSQDLPKISNIFRAKVFWLAEKILLPNQKYSIRIGSYETQATVVTVINCVNTETLVTSPVDGLAQNSCGEIIIRTEKSLALDDYIHLPETGRGVLIKNGTIVAGLMVSTEGYPDQRPISQMAMNLTQVLHQVTVQERGLRNAHDGAVIWLTGLSGAGKSTLAMALEKYLFDRGYQVYTLDGDNIRGGLNSDLDFSFEGRRENIRRVSEVARLFADAGLICITAFISPYAADRAVARNIVGKNFHEVFVRASVNICRTRDPKGLYAKASQGIIAEFTGVSSPYEEPVGAELIIDTEVLDIKDSFDLLINYVIKKVKRIEPATQVI